MVWFGAVWYGLVWFGMVWYGMVWYGLVWSGLVRVGMGGDYGTVSYFLSRMFCYVVEYSRMSGPEFDNIHI